MRALITSALIVLATLVVESQSFEVIDRNHVFTGKVGEKIVADIPIRNLTSHPIQLVIKRIDQVIGTSQTVYICWDGNCTGKNEDQLPLSKRVIAFETSTKLTSILDAGLVAGISTVKYLIYNRDNPSDAVEYEVNYTIEEQSDTKALFTSDDVVLNEIYPNPVSDFAILNYNLKNEDVQAKIVFHNVLGSVINEYILSPYEKRIKIITDDLNSGVYFYTLYIDGDGVATHKIVIRK